MGDVFAHMFHISSVHSPICLLDEIFIYYHCYPIRKINLCLLNHKCNGLINVLYSASKNQIRANPRPCDCHDFLATELYLFIYFL